MATVVPERYTKVQTWEDPSVKQNTGAWSTAKQETVKALGAGKYRTDISFELNVLTGGLNSTPRARFLINGNEKSFFNYEPGRTTWTTFSSFDLQQYSDGATPTIKIEFRKAGGTDTVQIRRIKIMISKVE